MYMHVNYELVERSNINSQCQIKQEIEKTYYTGLKADPKADDTTESGNLFQYL